VNLREQQDLIAGMERDARDCEFLLHDLYHRRWEHGIRAGDPVWDAWKRDLAGHKQKLQEALEAARAEAALKLRLQGAENDLSEARELRNKAEEDLRRAEQDWDKAQQEQQDLIFAWRKGLAELPLSDEAFQQVLHLLTRYPDISYEDVTVPVREAYDRVYKVLLQERTVWEHRKKGHIEQAKELRDKLQEWKDHKEPEPPRSEARERSRARRLAAGEPGTPLYAVCEFREGAPEEQKAALEAALDRAGLLDAWLSPGKVMIAGDDEEEVWVEARPDLLAHTLADYLYPTPPEGGSLTAEFIDRVLRTIRVGDADDSHAGAMVSEKGAFCLGPLAGQAPGKARAEYIGKEARRLTRLAEMARLEQLIREEEKAVQECEEHLLVLAGREQTLKEELDRFPAGDSLYQANALVESRQRSFGNAKEEEEKRHSQFKTAQNQWLEARSRLKQLTESWSMPQTEQGINGALNSLRSYQDQFSELKGKWTGALTLEKALAAAERDWEEACGKVEEETDYLRDKEDEFKKLRTRIEVFERLLQELGIYDIHKQIRELKELEAKLEGDIDKCKEKINEQNVAFQVLEIEVRKSHEAVIERDALCQAALKSWLKEWNRRLAPDWQEEMLPDARMINDGDTNGDEGAKAEAAVLKLAQRIRQQYRGKYEQRTRENVTDGLYNAFYQIRQTLHEYSPEQLTDPENNRILIVFMRDRQNPITPQHLLKELNDSLEEQRLLLDEKDRELYEQIIIHSVGKVIRQKIYRAEEWVRQMNTLMQQRETSSGLKLRLKWEPRAAANENELDTAQLVKYLKTDADLLRDEQREQMISHFKSRISWAKRESEDHKETLRHWINQLLDYRRWFRFTLEYEKGEQPRRELTDARFNVLSGGEKAMAMYIPLFAATYSRYADSREDAPKLISLDEAFAGVDDENMRDMFELLTQLDFDYMMTSQVLWGCYDTVPSLSIYELFRPKDAGFVTLIRYHWNGYRRELVDELADNAANVAATAEDAD
ncbi:MAG: TIGR02680 family protein, partial [Bacillota bacterium]